MRILHLSENLRVMRAIDNNAAPTTTPQDQEEWRQKQASWARWILAVGEGRVHEPGDETIISMPGIIYWFISQILHSNLPNFLDELLVPERVDLYDFVYGPGEPVLNKGN